MSTYPCPFPFLPHAPFRGQWRPHEEIQGIVEALASLPAPAPVLTHANSSGDVNASDNNNNSHSENDLHAPSTPSSSSSLALVTDANGSGVAGGVVTLGDWLVGKQVRGDRSATNVYHSLFFELSRTHSLTITPNITFYHCLSLLFITNTYHRHPCLSLISGSSVVGEQPAFLRSRRAVLQIICRDTHPQIPHRRTGEGLLRGCGKPI